METKATDTARAEDQVLESLRRIFAACDRDGDEKLKLAELDAAIIASQGCPTEAKILAMLKHSYHSIRKLHKEGWFRQAAEITLSDLLVFEELLKAESDAQLTTEKEELQAVAHGIMRRINAVSNASRDLFGSKEEPLSSIKPIAVRQGIVGSCVFLASLASVAACNPDSILLMIRVNGDDTYTVTFPGDPDSSIDVTAPNLVELALYAQLTRLGTWPCVLEKAYGAYLHKTGKRDSIILQENADRAETMHQSLDLLTGHTGIWYHVSELSDERLTDLLASAFKEKRASVAASVPERESNHLEPGLPFDHAFSVIDWDNRRKRLTLRNPWGPGRPFSRSEPGEPVDSQGKVLDRVADGTFSMGIARFRKNFSLIYVEERD